LSYASKKFRIADLSSIRDRSWILRCTRAKSTLRAYRHALLSNGGKHSRSNTEGRDKIPQELGNRAPQKMDSTALDRNAHQFISSKRAVPDCVRNSRRPTEPPVRPRNTNSVR